MNKKPPLANLPEDMAYVDTDNWSWEYPLPDKKANHVLYWNYDVAYMWLNENDVDFRVTSIDGRPLWFTQELKPDRANLTLINNKIENITYG